MTTAKPRTVRLVELYGLVLACLLIAPVVFAQGFFRVSPGPLNESHAAYDNSESCDKCHVSGQGVTNQKCLGCHGTLMHKGGLHSTFGGRACINCHVQHRGRSFNIIEWKEVGGRDGFKHDLTGFSLSNHHGQVACTKCHVKRLKSGRVSYLGLSKDCQSCHAGVHGFTHRELSQNCETCHASGRPLKGQTLRNWSSQHAQYAKQKLEGDHLDLACTRCHENGHMGGRTTPRSCADCHAASHPITGGASNCLDCHSQSMTFKGAKIDHERFGFALT